MISLDTNVVLRFLLDDVPGQTVKVKNLINKEEVYVTDAVVIEVVYVLEKVYQYTRSDIVKLVSSFLYFGSVTHNPYFLLSTLDMYLEHSALSMVDCYASVEARVYGNQLTTFDKKLALQGGNHVFDLNKNTRT